MNQDSESVGRLIGWVATSTHRADTGGNLRGAATEIFHEGIRIMGLKGVERGIFREDVFESLTEQCRDPQYVGLDLKAMIAGNNVCGRRYLGLVDKFGLEFVQAAAPDGKTVEGQPLARIHQTLEVVRNGIGKRIRCMRCGFDFSGTDGNYKKRCLKRVVELDEIGGQHPVSGDGYLGRYHEYICPGCATLLQVDVYCPELGGEEDLWDIHIEA